MESSREVKIVNKYGLHARPSAEFVKTAGRFSADVWVSKDGLDVSGKSIMGVMMLAAEFGSTIVIRANGADSEAVLDALCSLVASRFGEE